MAKKIIFTACLVALLGSNYAQRQSADTSKVVNLKEVVITSNKIPIRLINNPGAVTLISLEQLKSMPKGVGVEEALRLTPVFASIINMMEKEFMSPLEVKVS